MIALEWTPTTESLPDDDTLVLIALNDDEVWTGFRDGGIWHYVDAMPIDAERVTHWMHMPPLPAAGMSRACAQALNGAV